MALCWCSVPGLKCHDRLESRVIVKVLERKVKGWVPRVLDVDMTWRSLLALKPMGRLFPFSFLE